MKQAKRWRVHDRSRSNLIDHLLDLRGLKKTDLKLDYETGYHDPLKLPDMAKAVKLTREIISAQKPILVFGDYDADGTPAAALLYLALTRVGAKVEVVLPKRKEGYGLNDDLIREFATRASLLIAVDNGVTAVAQTKLAHELGLKVIILDHHLPQKELPPAEALVDPFVADSTYPYPYLCGCALAHKFIVALSSHYPKLSEGYCKWLLDMVAISTVADVMPMTGENRILVHYGLKVLQKTKNLGLKSLLAEMGLSPEKITVESLGYALGPRLNAGGRMGDNRPAFELLVSQDATEARKISQDVNRANVRRQAQVDEVLFQAEQLVWQQNNPDDRILVVIGQDWNAGVVGLVAGRLVGRYHRPVLVGRLEAGHITGSARSISAYPVIEGLTKAEKYLTRFGGHRQAAGFSLENSQLEQFTTTLKGHAQKHLSAEDLIPIIEADAVIKPEEISLETVNEIEALAPFGNEFPEPLLILESVQLEDIRSIGSKNDHLKARIVAKDTTLDLIGFRLAEQALTDRHDNWHLAGYLEKNHWNGRDRLQFRLVDYLPATANFETVPSNGQIKK